MHSAVVVAFAACVAAASAQIGLGGVGIGHGLGHGIGHGIVKDLYAYPKYKYSYGVADKLTGDQKSAYEVRDGGVTKGSYSLVQPDGVLRTVNYISTPHGGFQAQVINKGVAGHPAIYGLHKGVVGLGHGGLAQGIGHGIGHVGLGHGIGHVGLGHGIGHVGLGHGIGHLGGAGIIG